ncbi:hypothetical protein VE01_06324 [Pseudogymnoascus verrucosus]|uniref:TauD/TfdA-like domain-containing protein n=1 Tax=Pseudogymnoascus verrucosus TaxID=342668 RepID=A0A1B8GG39_9PEZI|nr:uncharacterized protein VE01_06324 [Pseudogymnoascus verrucosus]OBT94798.1 hypothetical protein VE01_06324 [Pseudogymnoascus verrucosus]
MALVHPTHPLTTTSSPDPYALPPSFPSSISSPLAWTGADLADESYIYHLTPSDLSEIKDALAVFKSHNLNGDLATPTTFPLPTLGPKLRLLSHELYNGRGVCLIRGLTPEMYEPEEGMVVFMGVQSYMAGGKGRQDGRGNMIVHITPSEYDAKHSRHSMDSLPFHTEATGDILAWQTRAAAAEGGKCIVSSAYTAYNLLAATCPEVIHTLAKPDWPFAYPTLHYRPILYHTSPNLLINFSPSALLSTPSHPRPSHLPSLTPSQLSALSALQAVARATELHITTKAGDLHFVNNLAIMHRRSAFSAPNTKGVGKVDGEMEEPKRHLVRMRLRCPERGWKIPRELAPAWEEAFGEEGEREWHLFPMPEGYFPLRKYPE